jgi:hypothetical protein
MSPSTTMATYEGTLPRYNAKIALLQVRRVFADCHKQPNPLRLVSGRSITSPTGLLECLYM